MLLNAAISRRQAYTEQEEWSISQCHYCHNGVGSRLFPAAVLVNAITR